MSQSVPESITPHNLAAVMNAAALLRSHNLISVEQIRGIRAHVHSECERHLGRYADTDMPDMLRMLADVFCATMP